MLNYSGFVPRKFNIASYKPPTVLHKEPPLEEQIAIKRKIKELEQSIRKKWRALKLGKAEEDESLNRMYKPLFATLNEFKKPLERTKKQYLKVEKQEDQIDEQDDDEGAEEEEEWEDTTDDFRKYFEQYPPLAKYYLEGYFTRLNDYDQTYGIKFDLLTNKLKIGNTELKIGSDSEVIIGDKTFIGSKGLFSLLFLKHPQDYTENDLVDYKKILEITSAHKRNYNPLEQLAGTKSYKYTTIIKGLFKNKPTGSGMNFKRGKIMY